VGLNGKWSLKRYVCKKIINIQASRRHGSPHSPVSLTQFPDPLIEMLWGEGLFSHLNYSPSPALSAGFMPARLQRSVSETEFQK